MGRKVGSVTGVVVTHMKPCQQCGEDFEIVGHPGSASRSNKRKYCSTACYAKARYEGGRSETLRRYAARPGAKEYLLRYRNRTRESANEYVRNLHRRLRAEVIAAYGSRCACCGLDDVRFLTIDRVANNGAQHRRQNFKATKLLRHIIKCGFPPDFQVLCFNCNCAKGIYGECPHRSPPEATMPIRDTAPISASATH